MKNIIIASLFALVATATVHAQSNTNTDRHSNTRPPTVWNPPKAACDAYNADRQAAENSAGAKSENRSSDPGRETRARDIIMPIICNPPARR